MQCVPTRAAKQVRSRGLSECWTGRPFGLQRLYGLGWLSAVLLSLPASILGLASPALAQLQLVAPAAGATNSGTPGVLRQPLGARPLPPPLTPANPTQLPGSPQSVLRPAADRPAVNPAATEPRLPAPPPKNEPVVLSPEMQRTITRLIREQLPPEFENHKKWNLTKEVVRGIDIRREGLKIKTHRRRKQVYHGKWQMYRAKVVDPEKSFHVEVDQLRQLPNGHTGVHVRVLSELDVVARHTNWKNGLRLYSLTAEADAKVRLDVDFDVAVLLDPTKFPPDAIFVPRAQRAELTLVEFKLRRLSDLRGKLADKVGDIFRKIAEDELVEKRQKLVDSINKQLIKKQGKLRLSLSSLVNQRLDRFLKLQPAAK